MTANTFSGGQLSYSIPSERLRRTETNTFTWRRLWPVMRGEDERQETGSTIRICKWRRLYCLLKWGLDSCCRLCVYILYIRYILYAHVFITCLPIKCLFQHFTLISLLILWENVFLESTKENSKVSKYFWLLKQRCCLDFYVLLTVQRTKKNGAPSWHYLRDGV